MALFSELAKTIDSAGEGSSLSLRQGSAEFQFFIAKAELKSGDNPTHGFSHLADLLFYDPGNRDWLAIVDAYLERASAETLLPEAEQRYFATEAVRALLWARAGRLDEAAQLWSAVHRAKSDSRYLQTWGLDAFEPDGAIEGLDEDTGMNMLGRMLVSLHEQRFQTARTREISRRWGKLALRFAASHPGRPELAMIVPGLLRKAGLFDDALAWVRRTEEPTWHSAVAE